MAILKTGPCFTTELELNCPAIVGCVTALPIGPAAVAGTTQVLGKDGQYHVLPAAPAAGPVPDGSETKVIAGTNATVTGTGTTAAPYVVNAKPPQILRAVKAAANTLIANNTQEALVLDTVEDNTLTSGTFNAATSTFTATENCIVSISVQSHVVFDSPTAITGVHSRVSQIITYKNGATLVGLTQLVDETTSNAVVGMNPTSVTNIALQAGDTLQVFIRAISAAAGGNLGSSITPSAVQATSYASRLTHLSMLAWKA
jgi:hypothetical protein